MQDEQGRDALERLLPSPNKWDRVGESLLKSVFGALPVFGPFLTETVTLLAQGNAEEKTHEFLALLYKEQLALRARLEMSAEEMWSDPQFQAYFIRALRAALETHEREKLSALVSASLNSGSWNSCGDPQREFYWSLLRRYNALHLQTLEYLHSGTLPGGGDAGLNHLYDFFMHVVGFPAHHEEIGEATLGELYGDKLVTQHYGLGFPLTDDPVRGLTTLGGDFLGFIRSVGSTDVGNSQRPPAQ